MTPARGRPDLVAHVGEELGLGQIRAFRRLLGQPQLLEPAPLRDVPVDAQDGRPALVLDGRGVDLEKHPAAVLAELHGLEVVVDPLAQGRGDLGLAPGHVLGDLGERHPEELLARKAVDLAGPPIGIEDPLVLRSEDEDRVVGVFEDPAVILAHLAQLVRPRLDLELELLVGPLQLPPFQLGRPQNQEPVRWAPRLSQRSRWSCRVAARR